MKIWINPNNELCQSNHLYSIAVEKKTSRFNKSLNRYAVEVDATDEKAYHHYFAIKFFDNEVDAKSFANKLAILLNGDD